MGVLVVTCALPPPAGSCPEGGAPLDFGPRCGSLWLAFWCPEYRAVAAGEGRVWDFAGFEPYEEDSAILLRPQWLERMLDGVAPGEIMENVVRAFGAYLPALRDSGQPLPVRTSFLVHPWPYPLIEKALGFYAEEKLIYWADEGIWGEFGCMVGFDRIEIESQLHDGCLTPPLAARSASDGAERQWEMDCLLEGPFCRRKPLPFVDVGVWQRWWGDDAVVTCRPGYGHAEGRAAA